MTQDAGALLKLADWLKHMQGQFEFVANDPIIKGHIADLVNWENFARQAASQGSAGGERSAVQSEQALGWNATQRELEIRQLRIDNARLRDEAFLRSHGAAQAAVPFLCPCCGARGSTDGKASTVSSAQQNSLEETAQRLVNELTAQNIPRDKFFIGIGAAELHAYVQLPKVDCRADRIGGWPVVWHFNVGPAEAYAHSSTERE